jgi:hypothetical protein
MSTGDAQSRKNQAIEDVHERFGDPARTYRRAIADSKASGKAINAPGLKKWVVSSMQSISNAYVTATVLHCRQSWIVKWLERAYQGIVAIGAVVAKIIGVAAKFAGDVADGAKAAFDIVGAIIKYAPYAGAGLGAYMLYAFVKNRDAR